MKSRLSVFLLTFSVLIALSLPVSALFPSLSEAKLYSSVIRLHVLANSDSAEDQQLKLSVRDEVLNTVSDILRNAESKSEAEEVLKQNIELIKQSAEKVIVSSGYSYSVSVTLTEEQYPTRTYENVTLPAGEYTSLRILIGEAEGQNWWCVLFPKLCITAETEVGGAAVIDETEEELVRAGLTPDQIRLITGNSPDVKIKFRILEYFGVYLS